MVVTTTPTPNGGSTVRSVAVTQGLQGASLVSGVPYRAVEVSVALVNYLPPPGTGTFFNVVSTLLVPRGNAPAMLLVMVFKGTLASDGTVIDEVEQTYLLCSQRGRAATAA
jgi:hypothetical protein